MLREEPGANSIPYACVDGPPEDWRDYGVFLDGEEVSGCIEANAKEGWVRQFQRKRNGKLLLDMLGEYALSEVKYGKVEILRRH